MTRDIRVAVLGGGSWGTTVASLAAARTETVLWARRQSTVDAINDRHENYDYLQGLALHPRLTATTSLKDAVYEADVVVVGVPSQSFRETLTDIADFLRPWIPLVSLSKGLERGTRMRMTQVIEDVLPGHPAGVLSGPNLAREVLQGFAAAAVIAMPDQHLAESLQRVFASTVFRVYTNNDVIGCELGGALKNVIAIAAGMAEGLGVGDNTRAMVITRGLAEMTRLGVAMGGDPRTFAGLTGLGDLMATCLSPLSRNRRVGEEIARGRTVEEITTQLGMVAEGTKSAQSVVEIAHAHGVEVPVAEEVAAVVRGERTAQQAYRGLGKVRPTSELHGVV
ncbi:MAG TPA: NAD(P)H-dependent glycerol-3-phosphate dehydrogenase [Frankiaceae bacterium]|jgi:glycerol-3-phosphate dehydrogenase (NAD(P)+)|nr:NAD(P)H-dependent glycerol-3-phosphate dehydrogenase [Frankiaceae bacterium]